MAKYISALCYGWFSGKCPIYFGIREKPAGLPAFAKRHNADGKSIQVCGTDRCQQ